jgi:hypothetical protein
MQIISDTLVAEVTYSSYRGYYLYTNIRRKQMKTHKTKGNLVLFDTNNPKPYHGHAERKNETRGIMNYNIML